MTESRDSAILAVDGGGTRCRVACEVGGILYSAETGAANVSTDFEGGVRHIRAGIAKVAETLNKTVEELVQYPAFVGLAGLTDETLASRLRSALGLAKARIEDDRPAALRGALGDSDGIVAHCGTGSFLAMQVNGVMRFAGGWGPVLGDEASAQWVGRLAMAETLNAADKIHAHTELTRDILERFGGTAGIVDFAGKATPSQFGAIAPNVTAAADAGDVVAIKILRAGADHIAEMSKLLGWRVGQSLCLTGGIAPCYATYLPAEMQSSVHPPLGEPMSGALALAKEVRDEYR